MPVDSLRAAVYDVEQVSRVLQVRGKNAEAIALLKAVSDRLDGDASLHSALGRLYEISGDPKSAKAQAERALAIDSLDTRAVELRRRLSS